MIVVMRDRGSSFISTRVKCNQGTWLDDVLKCGSLEGFDEERASNSAEFPIPVVRTGWAFFIEK